MGRFQREAVTVDLNDPNGSVYQTEDDYSGLFYKFVPNKKNNLSGKGKLYALKIPGVENTSNKDGLIRVGDNFAVEWVRINDPLAKSTKTKTQGKKIGASIFNGGEGIIFTNDKNMTTNIFFTCKKGGKAGLGQIWKYSPVNSEISLFYESDNADNLWEGDNINITPWGDLIICEDNGSNACKLIGITPNGFLYPLGRVAGNSSSEIAGICFSPNGKNMYLNIQDEGKTIAISGDWNKIREYRNHFDSSKIHY
jgi:secreted PhoX family phosphatase